MVDVSDAPANQGIMIALLPVSSEWCEIELPHLTLVYAGTVDKRSLSDHNALAKDAAMMAQVCRPFALAVTHVDVFGDEEKVDVLRFRPTPELMAMRRMVERWNASQHSFKPHSTIGPVKYGRDVRDFPRIVGFDRLMVGWGDDQMTFWLNKNY